MASGLQRLGIVNGEVTARDPTRATRAKELCLSLDPHLTENSTGRALTIVIDSAGWGAGIDTGVRVTVWILG